MRKRDYRGDFHKRVKSHREKFKVSLAERRKAAGLTYQKLSDISGIPIGSVNNYCRGMSIPPEDNLKSLAEALGCKPEDLISSPRPQRDYRRLKRVWSNIKFFMNKGGIDPSTVSKATGIPIQTLYRGFRNGNAGLGPDNVRQIAKCLIVDPEELEKGKFEDEDLIFKQHAGSKAASNISEVIKALMEVTDTKPHRLSKMAGISHGHLSIILEGNTVPKTKTLRAIASALNVSVPELLTERSQDE